jgi:hypothetical protein
MWLSRARPLAGGQDRCATPRAPPGSRARRPLASTRAEPRPSQGARPVTAASARRAPRSGQPRSEAAAAAPLSGGRRPRTPAMAAALPCRPSCPPPRATCRPTGRRPSARTASWASCCAGAAGPRKRHDRCMNPGTPGVSVGRTSVQRCCIWPALRIAACSRARRGMLVHPQPGARAGNRACGAAAAAGR